MIYLIAGPPGSGKNKYVDDRMSAGDIIIDFDILYQALTGSDDHAGEYALFDRVNDCRHYLISTSRNYPEVRHTWIIICAPTAHDIALVESMDGQLIYLDVLKRVCLRRCIARGGDPVQWSDILDKWFTDHDGEFETYA